MKKFLVIASLMAMAFATLAAQSQHPNKKIQDKSTHHAAMHAEHWLSHHVSAPHRSKAQSRRMKKKQQKAVNSVHHAAIHAEHWIDRHASAPHKKGAVKHNH